MKRNLLIIILLVVTSNISFAKSAGTTMANFLKLGVDARAIAMGSAFAGVADDVHAVYWNPAGLNQIQNKEISFSHLSYLALINYENIQYASKLGTGTLGFDIKYLYMEDERRNDLGDKIGSFTNNNTAVNVVYSNNIKDNLMYGLGAKIVQIKLDDETGSGFVLDTGLFYILNEKVNIGIVLQNLGLKMKIANDEANLPANLKIGTSYQALDQVLIAFDINYPFEGESSFNIGTEYVPMSTLSIRAGYIFREQGNMLGSLDGASLGIGLNIKKYSLDYAFVPFGEFSQTHRMSFNVKL